MIEGKYRGNSGYGYGREKSIVLLFALISLRKCVCKCVDFYVGLLMNVIF